MNPSIAKPRFDPSGYELKNVKRLQTWDGVAWSGTLYRDGHRVGLAENTGTGGPSVAHFDHHEGRQVFSTWVTTLGQHTIRLIGHDDLVIDFSEEVALDELMTLWEDRQLAKKLDRDARKKFLMKTAKHGEDEYGTFKAPPGVDPTTPAGWAWVKRASWWPEVTHIWVIGQGWQAPPELRRE